VLWLGKLRQVCHWRKQKLRSSAWMRDVEIQLLNAGDSISYVAGSLEERDRSVFLLPRFSASAIFVSISTCPMAKGD
jgi:hypothetical protein